MSKLLDNKQIIHIVSEIVIILGITFYFSQKNKKIMNHINDLTQRIEEQEDVLQKHEQMISKLTTIIDEFNSKQSGFYPMDNFTKEIKVPGPILKNSIPNNPFSHSTIILETLGPLRADNKSSISESSSRVVEIIDDNDENVVKKEHNKVENKKEHNKVENKKEHKVEHKVEHKKEHKVENKKEQNIGRVEEIIEEDEEEPSEEDLDAELEDELKELD